MKRVPVSILNVTGSGDDQKAEVVTNGSSSCRPAHLKVAAKDVRTYTSPLTPASVTTIAPPPSGTTTSTVSGTTSSTTTAAPAPVKPKKYGVANALVGPVTAGVVSGVVQAIAAQAATEALSTPQHLQELAYGAAGAAVNEISASLARRLAQQIGLEPDPSSAPTSKLVAQVDLTLKQTLNQQIMALPAADQVTLVQLANPIADQLAFAVAQQLAELQGDNVQNVLRNATVIRLSLLSGVERAATASLAGLPPTE